MRARAGLVIDEGRVTLAFLSAEGAFECLELEPGDDVGTRLAAELDARGYQRRRVRIGLDRSLVVVKVLEVPRTEGGSLGEMVRFELERHVPFAAEDMASDWSLNTGKADGPLLVLVGACDARAVDQALRILGQTRRRPLAMSVACHDLRALLPAKVHARRSVWAHRHHGRTDLLFLARGLVRLSRAVPVETPPELAREIKRTLSLLEWRDGGELWISGDEAEEVLEAAPELGELGIPVGRPPYSAAMQAIVDTMPDEQRGSGILGLAVAVGSWRPRINFLPRALRPRRASPSQLVTAGMACLVALLGLGLLGAQAYQSDRYVRRISQDIRLLDPEVKAVQRLAAEVAQKKKLVSTLQGLEAGGLHPLPFLRDLTELLPPDAWLQALNMDGQGVEMIGQAGTASQLIPTLEASPWLERVEFTSPVTKGQGKEQFRLRASWERR